MTRPGADARRGVRVWLERIVVLGVLIALTTYVLDNWGQVRDYPWVFRWHLLSLATVLAIGVYSGFVLLWRRLVIVLGGDLSIVDAHRVWYLGNLGRYVPGKIAQIAGTAYLANAVGVRPTISVTASVLSQVYVLATAIALALVALGPDWLPGISTRGSAVLGVAIVLLLLSPAFDLAARLALRWTDRSIDVVVNLGLAERIRLSVGYLTCWVVFGVAFKLFVSSVLVVPSTDLLDWVGIHAAAYSAGWLAIFAPGGIGVREGAYAVLLSPVLTVAGGAAVALLSRLWLTACEVGVTALLVSRYGVRDLGAAAWRTGGA